MFRTASIVRPFCKGTVQALLKAKVNDNMKVHHLEIENESSKHQRGPESHFNLLIVSDEFKAKTPIQKQRLVYGILEPEMKIIHALTLTCKSVQEWEKHKQKSESPSCLNKRP